MHLLPVLVVLLQSVRVLVAFRDLPANSSAFLPSRRLPSNKASVFADPFRNALSRKKRSFVFYKGTVVVLTDVCALSIPGGTPKALVQSNEIDIFYDVPLLVDGWQQPIDAFLAEYKAQSKEDEEAAKEDEELKNVGVVNASAIPLKEYNKLAYMRPTWSQYPVRLQDHKRVWEPSGSRHPVSDWRPNYRGSNRYYYPNSYRRNYVQHLPGPTSYPARDSARRTYEDADGRPYHAAKRSANPNPQEWSNYRGYSDRQAYDDRQAYNDRRAYEDRQAYDDRRAYNDRQAYDDQYGAYQNYVNAHRRAYVAPTTTEDPLPPTPKESVREAYEETDRSFHEAKRSAMENPQKWHHHREYRERRAFYDHLEAFGKMLGVSLRKCIQRAICEMKEQLLPEGESLINDIARILFTVPTEHDVHDEFTEIAREENVDCARRFVVSCPHSPLHYFQNNFRASGQPSRPPTAEEALRSIIYA